MIIKGCNLFYLPHITSHNVYYVKLYLYQDSEGAQFKANKKATNTVAFVLHKIV